MVAGPIGANDDDHQLAVGDGAVQLIHETRAWGDRLNVEEDRLLAVAVGERVRQSSCVRRVLPTTGNEDAAHVEIIETIATLAGSGG